MIEEKPKVQMERRRGHFRPFIRRRMPSEVSLPFQQAGENLPVQRESRDSQGPVKIPINRGEAPPEEGQELEQGLYIISVAARLLEMHPQTLRKYERFGLISPSRTVGMLRLYSEEDIAHLRLIKHLVDDLGLNLAGVELALSMVNHLMSMRRQVEALEQQDLKSFLEQRLGEILSNLRAEFP